jgi:integrase
MSGATSTRLKRLTAWKHWTDFVKHINFTADLISPAQIHICLWMVYLLKKGLTYGTIRAYLYSLKAEILLRGGNDILAAYDCWFIQATLKHFRRELGSAPIQYRRPLTLDMLPKLMGVINLKDYDTNIYATMAVVGVYCLLRIGELCSVRYDKRWKFIRNSDFKFSKDSIVFILRQTKTDLDKKGVAKAVGNIQATPSPYKMLYILKSTKVSSTKPDEPFFALRNGKAVTRPLFVHWLKASLRKAFPLIPSNEWNGISIRKGGATSAVRAGVSGEVVQKLGNWKSDAYKSYVDHSPVDIVNAQNKMATWSSKGPK